MIEDDLEGNRPTIRYRLSIARSGLNEQLRDAGLIGNSLPASEQDRAGALTVLCAFALFVIPGVAFAKISEHWDESIHRGSWHLPAISFNLLASLAGACALAVVLAAVALIPIFIQFLGAGGWSAIGQRVRWAVIATAATGAIVGGLAVWASHLNNHQRNVGFGWYQLVFAIAAILFAVTVGAWLAAAVATTCRLNIGSVPLKVVGVLAILVAVCMPIMTAAAAVWWGSMASIAPWFLAGTPTGSSSSPLDTDLLVVLIVMMFASGVGVLGSFRVIRSSRLLRSGCAGVACPLRSRIMAVGVDIPKRPGAPKCQSGFITAGHDTTPPR
jgi:MFS family permease